MDFPDGFCYFVPLVKLFMLPCILSAISVNEELTSVLALARLGLTTGFPAQSS